MADEIVNVFNEPLYLPASFVHPKLGAYKDKPEEFFAGVAVRIFTPVDIGGKEMQAPIWLDVVGFRDDVVDGRPCRMGYGRTQKRTVFGPDGAIDAGIEMPFDPAEVVDVIERFQPEPGGVYIGLTH